MNPITEREGVLPGFTKQDVKVMDTPFSPCYWENLSFVTGVRTLKEHKIACWVGCGIGLALAITFVSLGASVAHGRVSGVMYGCSIVVPVLSFFAKTNVVFYRESGIFSKTVREFEEWNNRMKKYENDDLINEEDSEFLFRCLDQTYRDIKFVTGDTMTISGNNFEGNCQRFLENYYELVCELSNDTQKQAALRSLKDRVIMVPLRGRRKPISQPPSNTPVYEPALMQSMYPNLQAPTFAQIANSSNCEPSAPLIDILSNEA